MCTKLKWLWVNTLMCVSHETLERLTDVILYNSVFSVDYLLLGILDSIPVFSSMSDDQENTANYQPKLTILCGASGC